MLYKCDMCDKGFNQSWDLHKHSHTGVKPFKCNLCDMGFTKSGNFTNHKQSPTEVKLLRYDLLKPTEAKLLRYDSLNLEVTRLFYNDNNKEKLFLQ